MNDELKIHVTHMVHSGGTKCYTVVAVHNVTQKEGVIFTRWGKIGTSGQMKREESGATVKSKAVSTIRSKERKGYSITFDREFSSYSDLSELRDAPHELTMNSQLMAQIKDIALLIDPTDGHGVYKAEKKVEVERSDIEEWGTW